MCCLYTVAIFPFPRSGRDFPYTNLSPSRCSIDGDTLVQLFPALRMSLYFALNFNRKGTCANIVLRVDYPNEQIFVAQPSKQFSH